MTLSGLLIAPFKTGLDTDVEPWIAPVDSFRELDNIHIRYGYLEKRNGYSTFGALIPMGATVVINGITQADPGVVTTGAPHGYTTGDKVFLTGITGMTSLNNKIFTITVTSTTEFSIGIDTSSLTIYAGAGTAALTSTVTDRVMGIERYLEAGGGETLLAFNARRAYRYNKASLSFVQLDGADIFSSGDKDYIWSAQWQSGGGTNRLYFTNGLEGVPLGGPTSNGIRYYDGTVDPNNTVPLSATLGAGPPARTLVGAKLIFSLGQRLIVLNTYEYDTLSSKNYPQRARWCAKQNPGNWNDVTAGGGGYTDAATGDQIISAQAIQNQIIVFFTNSVWALIPTSDPNRAFRWKKLNNFRACDGKMASLAYDRYAVALGVRGITATDGVETRRVDARIEDFTTDNINVEQFQKVFCKRNYPEMRAWALYNNTAQADGEINRALIVDDNLESFSTYGININCLGYGNTNMDYTLDDFTVANDLDKDLTNFTDEDLFSYFLQEDQEVMLGGDLHGSIYFMASGGNDNGSDIASTFTTNAWNPFQQEGKEAQLSYMDLYVDTDKTTTATIEFFKDTDTAPYTSQRVDFLPNLNFVTEINSIDKTNPVNVTSTNHGLSTGDVIYIYGVLGMTSINSGNAAINYTITVVDENNFTLDGIDGTSFNAYTSGGGIYLRKFYKKKTWKRVFGGGIGFEHRIRFTSEGSDQPFRIHALKPYFKPVGNREVN